jgi:hypothetical protein
MSVAKKFNHLMQTIVAIVDNIILESPILNPDKKLCINPTETARYQGFRDLNTIGFRVLDYRLFKRYIIRDYRLKLLRRSLLLES